MCRNHDAYQLSDAFRYQGVSERGGKVVTPLLIFVEQIRERLHSIRPTLRPGASIGRAAIAHGPLTGLSALAVALRPLSIR